MENGYPVRTQMRFRFIDALRGVAALAVLFAHLTEFGRYNRWANWGVLGVPVFFVISGFVIAASNADQNLTANYVGRFILRRSLRLDPPYWVMLLIVIAFVSPLSPGDTFANMFYLHRILDAPAALNVAWTLCQEVQLYLFFVVSMAVFQKIGGGNARVSGTIAQAALAVFSVFTAHLYWHEFFIPHWYQFFAGVLAYWCASGRLHWGLVAAYLVLVSSRLYGDHSAVTVVCTATVLLVLRDRMTTLGSGRIPQFFGRISYSLYLAHVPFYALLCAYMEPGPVRVVTSVVGSVLAGWALYHFVERTALGWSAHVGKTAPPPAAPSPILESSTVAGEMGAPLLCPGPLPAYSEVQIVEHH
jgi:peptidoglycan/LPS O-acetylase OafA/YrhL